MKTPVFSSLRTALLFVCLATLCLFVGFWPSPQNELTRSLASAHVSPEDADRPSAAVTESSKGNFDARKISGGSEKDIERARAKRDAAAGRLATMVPGARVDFDEKLGTPKFVASNQRFLTGDRGVGGGVSAERAAEYAGNVAHGTVKAFIAEFADLFGHGPEVFDSAEVKRDFTTEHNGMRTTIWQQTLDGIRVFESTLQAHVTNKGALVNVASTLLADVDKAAGANRQQVLAKPPVDVRKAIRVAAAVVGDVVPEDKIVESEVAMGQSKKQRFRAPAVLDLSAEFVWLPTSAEAMTLCWEVVHTSKKRGEMFRTLVDASTGVAVVQHGLTEYISPASYRVFPSDSPTPMSPGHATPLTTQPAAVARSLITLDALNTTASPDGWINDGVTETRGNNVEAHLDLNADNIADSPRPQGVGAGRVFDPVFDPAQAPSTYRDASVVNLFYWNNVIHDRFYELGFTEAAGNFQTNNFGRGGNGNDAVQADSQDGSGTNNANFSTPADGSPGRMQMFVFTGPTPDRDSSFDTEIVIHEYTHGLSNRLVGGGVGISALQSRGMGEGWSDFYALGLLSEPSDNFNGQYAKAGYSTREIVLNYPNYYFGIRRYPYSTDMTKSPLTFRDIDPTQARAHTGIPLSPRYTASNADPSQFHGQGEVWCNILREAWVNLVTAHGHGTGNTLALRLVTDGMKLSPANPNFVQARDAILQAELVYSAGANRNHLWAGFAKRGLGSTATSPANNTTTGVVESYSIPDDLAVGATGTWAAVGVAGGPFSPATNAYALANSGTGSLNWTASSSQPWVTLSATSGTLAAGANTTVTASLAPSAASLAVGTHSAILTFTNTTSGIVQSRQVSLTVEPFSVTIFQENWESGTARSMWALTGTNTHRTQVTTANAPRGGTWHMTMDSSVDGSLARNEATLSVDLLGRQNVRLKFWVKMFNDEPNGPPTIPFTTGADFDGVAVSANGTTWYEVQPLRTLVSTWTEYTVDLSAAATTHGLTLGSGFKIRFNHYDDYGITTDGFAFDDIRVFEAIDRRLSLSAPASVMENGASVDVTLSVVPVQAADVTVALSSDDVSEMTVPTTVVIPAGQASVVFQATPQDDASLDGGRAVTLSATAAAFASGTATVQVGDSETTTLVVSLPASATEGVSATGTVSTGAAVNENVQVALGSSVPADLQVPAMVTILAGQTTVSFTATPVDDSKIDGTVSATVSAHVDGWTDGSATVAVLDNETTALAVTLPTMREGDAGKIGTVALSGTLTSALTATLSSSDSTALTVPASVTIAAGATSATFTLTIVDDAAADGAQAVMVTASAAGFSDGTAVSSVADNDAHHFTIGAVASPQIPNANFAVSVTARDVNDAVITNFNTALSLTAAGDGGAVAITPALLSVWAGGVATANVKVLASATNVVLTASDAGGHFGASNAFDVVVGPPHHFAWNAIPSPQYRDTPFVATVTAQDVANNPVMAFGGTAALSARSQGSVQVLSWTLYSDNAPGGEYANTKTAISTYFTNYSETTTTVTDPAQLASALVGKHVFLIPEQENETLGSLGSIGGTWATVLQNFVYNGGVVIACSWQKDEHQLLSQAGLMTATLVSSPSSLSVTKTAGTSLNNGVATPFTGSYINTYSGSNGIISLHSAADGTPVVLSRALGAGQVVLIGTDYYTLGTGMDRVVANAVALADPSGGGSLPLSPVVTGNFVNGVWSGNLVVPYTTSSIRVRADDGASHIGDSNSFAVAAPTAPPAGATTVVTLPTQVTEGTGARTGTVTLAATSVSDRTVALASSAPAKISVPASVAVLAGQTSATFTFTVENDLFLDGNKSVFITALAPGDVVASAATLVIDDDLPTIALSPTTVNVTEGDAPFTFTATLGAPPAAPITLDLSASPEGQVTVPATVSFAIGELTKTFSATIVNDTAIDGAQSVTLALGAVGWTPGTATVTVMDNENTNLALTVPAVLREGQAVQTGTITISGTLATALTVALSSSDTTEVTVPASVTIPAGQATANFAITVVNDTEYDGAQSVTIDAAAAGFASASAVRSVIDNDAHHLTFAPIGSPQVTNGPIAVVITARDSADGIVADYVGTVTLTATGNSGGLAVSPTTITGFANGAKTTFVQLNAAATAVVLTATDGAGRTGTSNPFDIAVGNVTSFAWDPVPTQQTVDTPFPVRIRALDSGGNTAVGFNGAASLSTLVNVANPQVGTGASGLYAPLNTYNHDSRSQMIFSAGELGGAAQITSLAINIQAATNEVLTNFTLRLKHTSMADLSAVTTWDNAGWTQVYRASPTVSGSGWMTFNFSTPFSYNGTGNLMLEWSMDRTSSSSTHTYVIGTDTSTLLTQYAASNSVNGDPLTWSGSTPYLNQYYGRPHIILTTLTELLIRPGISGNFVSGVWDGQVSVPFASSGLSLRASAGTLAGTSSTISVAAPSFVPSGSGTLLSENFESGVLNPAYWIVTGTGTYRTINTTTSTPRAGVRHMVMDSSIFGSAARNEATLALNLANRSGVSLSFWAKSLGDTPHGPPPSPFPSTGADFDGVAISADGGANWYEVQPLRSLTTAYAQYTVNLDAAMSSRGLSYSSGFRIRFNQYGLYYAGSAGISIDDIAITATPSTGPIVTVPTQATEGDSGVVGTLTLSVARAADTLVSLASSFPAKAATPATALIPAGDTSVTFPITLPDDALLDGMRTVIFTAVEAGTAPQSAMMTVLDNEVGTLTLSAPPTAVEGATGLAGTLSISPAFSGAVTINLTSSDLTELTVPASVTLPIGLTSATFPITIINDTLIDGTQTATITATVSGWTPATAVTQVTDNETRNLSLNIVTSITEGTTASGSVNLTGTLPAPLVVTLTSANPSQLSVPASVTIPAGSTSASFTATAVDDVLFDGTQSVLLTGASATFTSATATIAVPDNDVHHFTFTSAIAAAQTVNLPFSVSISARDINNVSISGFSGTTALAAAVGGTPIAMTPTVTGAFSFGSWTGNVSMTQPGVGIVITATGAGVSGASNSFTATVGATINVTPASITLAMAQGATETRTLSISNTGGQPLNWQIASSASVDGLVEQGQEFVGPSETPGGSKPEVSANGPIHQTVRTAAADFPESAAPPALSAVLNNLNANHGLVRGAIPGRYAFSEGVTGNNIADGGSDMYDNGNYLGASVTPGGYLNYSDNVFASSPLLGAGGQYFTRKLDGLFVFAADVNALTYFEITGNLGADGSGSNDTAVISMVNNGTNYRGFVKRVYNAGDPSVNHIIIIPDNGTAIHEASTDTNNDYHRVTGLTGVTRIYYLLYAGSAGSYINNTSTQAIMSGFLDAIAAPDWVTPNLLTGTVAVGGSQNVTLTFNTAGLASGTYTRNLILSSNDLARPSVIVPLQLTVTSVPNISITPPDPLAASGYRGGPFAPNSRTYTITNSGIASVNWTAAKTAAWLDISSTGGTIAAGASTTLVATVNASANSLAAGNFSGTITFTNTTNGTGNTTRSATLSVTPYGQLAVTPGTGGNYTLTNSGDAALNWTATADAWLSATPAAGTLSAGATAIVNVQPGPVAALFTVGHYEGALAFTNTSTAHGNTALTVTHNVFSAAPVIAPEPPFTGGTENTVTWATSIANSEAHTATDAAFTAPQSSGPLAALTHTFTGLAESAHFFRVRSLELLRTTTAWAQGTPAALGAGTKANVVADATGIVLVNSPSGPIAGRIANASFETDPLGSTSATSWTTASTPTMFLIVDQYTQGAPLPTNGTRYAVLYTGWSTTHVAGESIAISQSVDFTGSTQLVFDASLTKTTSWMSAIRADVKIDGVSVWSKTTEGPATNQTVNVSSLTGVHVVSLECIVTLGGNYDPQWACFDNLRLNGTGDYAASGNLVSAPIPQSLSGWGQLLYTADTPASTALTVDVLDGSSAALATAVPNGADLAAIPAVAAQPTIRLRANLTSTNTAATPRLRTWLVTSRGATVQTPGPWSNVVSSVQDAMGPIVARLSPPVTNLPSYIVRGTTTDQAGVQAVTVNGIPATSTDGFATWVAPAITLTPGANVISIGATDSVSNSSFIAWSVTLSDFATDADGDKLPDDWEAAHSLNPADGASADDDGDGLNSLLEFALGLDPKRYDGPTSSTTIEINPADGARYLVHHFRRRVGLPAWTFDIHAAITPGIWSTAATESAAPPTPHADGVGETIHLRVLPPVDGVSMGFIRLRVAAP